MKIYISFIWLCVLAQVSIAQNIVPNPSFELYNSCPTGPSQINYSNNYSVFISVQSWASPLQSTTPDYFNSCASAASGVSVPSNSFGYQTTYNGNAYTGASMYYKNPAPSNAMYVEYIYCRLNTPMVAGKRYKASFYVNLTTSNGLNNVALDAIGAYFSDTIVYRSSGTLVLSNYPYHIQSPTGLFLDDTVNWMEISGLYTAKGGEQYMLIGSFDYGVPRNLKQVSPPVAIPGGATVSYYYIDDVAVVEHPCDTSVVVHDSTICLVNPFILSSIAGANSYLWSTGATTRTVQLTQPGTYVCTAQIGTCDLRTDTFKIKLYTGQETSFFDTFTCRENKKISITLSPKHPAQDYLWSTGQTTPVIAVSDTGTYWCKSVDNCILYTDYFHINSFREYITTIIDTLVCRTQNPFMVSLSALPGAENYFWNDQSTNQTLSVNDTGKFICYAIKDCNFHTQLFNVKHKQFNVTLNIGNDTTLCGDIEQFTIGTSIPQVQYAWNTGDTNCCIRPPASGKYLLTITDGCTKLNDSININFTDCDKCIQMPTAFTPNKDGRNDYLGPIIFCGIKSYDFKVFSRWGELLFHSTNITDKWDGNYKSVPVDIGTCFFLIQYSALNEDRKRILKGDVTLIR